MLPPTDVNHSKSFGEQTGRCRVVANQRVDAARTAAVTGRNQMQLTGLKLGQGMPPAVKRAAAQLLCSEPQREQGGKLRQVARGLIVSLWPAIPLQQLLSREVTKGETAMEVERNMRRGGSKPSGKWQMKVSERPWDPPKRLFRAMLKNPM